VEHSPRRSSGNRSPKLSLRTPNLKALSDVQSSNLRQIVAEINAQTDFTAVLIRGFSDLLDRVLANRAMLSHETKLLRLKYLRVASRLRKIEEQEKIEAALALAPIPELDHEPEAEPPPAVPPHNEDPQESANGE